MKISKIKTGNGVILLENRRPKDRNRTFSKKFATGDFLGIIFHNKLLQEKAQELNKDAAGNSQTLIQFSHAKEDPKFIKPDKEMKNQTIRWLE